MRIQISLIALQQLYSKPIEQHAGVKTESVAMDFITCEIDDMLIW